MSVNSQIKGYEYEINVKNYIINKLNKLAYLWKETPEKILINCGIIGSHNDQRLNRKDNIENPLQDTGIDIIQIDSLNDNICSLIQCKNGYENGITLKDLAGFNAWMAVLDKLNGYVYYTNKLSHPIKSLPNNDRIKYIKYINNIIENNNTQIENNINKVTPFQYQLIATETCINYLKKNDRGILSMPCGTGKTFISYLISNNYKQIILISPLKQFAKQNLNKYIEYGYKNNTLLVDSDGERDVKQIEKFIKLNNSFIISSTFCSVDVINECLKYMTNPLIIIDEFHNISKTNILDENDNFNKILYSEYLILFMSATPRIYEMENDEFDYEDIFGKIIYNMSFNEAIQNKYITDYCIWLPSIHEDNTKLNTELNIYKINQVIMNKCNFLFSCLLNNGSRKCIIYCLDTNEIKEMIDAIKTMNQYYYLDYEINQITSIDTEKNRKNILKNFEDSSKLQLLFSIRILDECIDLPKCDSIYITYPSESKIRTIQRLSRCIRIDKLNKFKIGNIYIWCDKYDNIINTLSTIKEYDIFFKNKIKINEINFYNENNKNDLNKDIELINKYIIDIKEYKIYTWDENITQVKEYINEYKKRPSHRDIGDSKRIGNWLETQISNFNKKEYNMKDNNLYLKFNNFLEEYKQYFIKKEDKWIENLEKLKLFIDINNKRPSEDSTDENIKKLGKWTTDQLSHFKNNTKGMKNVENNEIFKDFINNDKYKKYFLLPIDAWNYRLETIKKYMDDNNKRPTDRDPNEIIRSYGNWINNQQKHYKKQDQIMEDELIREKWRKFIKESKYNKFFK